MFIKRNFVKYNKIKKNKAFYYPEGEEKKLCKMQTYVKKEIKSPMKLIYRNEKAALCWLLFFQCILQNTCYFSLGKWDDIIWVFFV